METSRFTIERLLRYFPKSSKRCTVLEPSAGKGKLARIIRAERKAKVFCAELNVENAKFLHDELEFTLIARDFLKFPTIQAPKIYRGDYSFNDFAEIRFDYIVAVPPYKDNIDIIHIQKMYDVCKKGGKVISLTLPHWITGFFQVQRDFRKWLQDKNYSIEILPDEDESYLNAPKAIIVINK